MSPRSARQGLRLGTTEKAKGIPHVTQLGINILQLHGFACSERPAFFLSHEGHVIFRLTLSLGFALAACTQHQGKCQIALAACPQHQGIVRLPLLPAHSIRALSNCPCCLPTALQAFEKSNLLYISHNAFYCPLGCLSLKFQSRADNFEVIYTFGIDKRLYPLPCPRQTYLPWAV